jgi:hypothetical protein
VSKLYIKALKGISVVAVNELSRHKVSLESGSIFLKYRVLEVKNGDKNEEVGHNGL